MIMVIVSLYSMLNVMQVVIVSLYWMLNVTQVVNSCSFFLQYNGDLGIYMKISTLEICEKQINYNGYLSIHATARNQTTKEISPSG